MPINRIYRGPVDMPGTIPVFPLEGALLLPRGQMPLNIFEPRYLEMVDDALRDGHRIIGMIQPDHSHPGSPSAPSLYRIGCAGRITQFAETGARARTEQADVAVTSKKSSRSSPATASAA